MGKGKRKYQANEIQQRAVSNPCTNAGPTPEKKARAHESEAKEAEALVANDFVLDKYRLHHEVEDHWELRRMFLEKNYSILPEDELECMAQVFMNIELLRCRYPPETMARVAELSEGLTSEYRHQRCNMLQRTFVSASSAAASKVQRKPLDLPANNGAGPQTATQSIEEELGLFEPILYPKTLEEMLRNIIVLNNSFDDTMRSFTRLGVQGGWKLDTTVSQNGHLTCVKVGQYIIAQIRGVGDKKKMEKQARAAALEFLKKRCYTILRKKQPTEMDCATVIHKTSAEDNDTATDTKTEHPVEEMVKLDSSNIGFQLMAKLGWKGGSLGARGGGITDPVLAKLKVGRKGLGHEKPNEGEKKTISSYENIKKKLIELRDGVLQNHLVFSADFTKEERAEIRLMAIKVGGLQMKSIGSGNLAPRQLAVYVPEVSPHEKLKKILIEKDPFYCEMYEVIGPTASTS